MVDLMLWAKPIAGALILLLLASWSRGDRGARRDTLTAITPVPTAGGMGGGGAADMRIDVGPTNGMGGGGAAPKGTP